MVKMLIDANDMPANSADSSDLCYPCDLCVVGAGPAGIAIVDRLRRSGLSIVLLEGGGLDPEVLTQSLFTGENEGHDYFRLDACRFRLFGGGTNRWGGWCRPLDAADFTRRDWLPWSGWPISEPDLRPYYSDVAKLFELPNAHFDLESWLDRLPVPFPLEGTNFENIIFQFSSGKNFSDFYRARLAEDNNVTVLLHANLTKIKLAEVSNRVDVLQVGTLTGRTFTVRPRVVVLAAGGIENARLLLASRSDRATGLGNEFDLVGRFFMEHLHVPAGHLLGNPIVADRRFYRYKQYADASLRGVIIPSVAAQNHHELLATSIAIESPHFAFGTRYLGWPPQATYGPIRLYRRLRSGRLRPVVEMLKQNIELASGLPLRFRNWKAARAAHARVKAGAQSGPIYSLYFRSEQVPDPASRVTLSERRDALKVPEIKLNWRVNAVDIDSITRWLKILDNDFRARGLGRIVMPPMGWQHEIIGGPHHIGTTRMAADPRHGVVDEHCRVHSVSNLYIAGSSVFTTGGYANPTFTLMALALRLADTLRDRLQNEHLVGPTA